MFLSRTLYFTASLSETAILWTDYSYLISKMLQNWIYIKGIILIPIIEGVAWVKKHNSTLNNVMEFNKSKCNNVVRYITKILYFWYINDWLFEILITSKTMGKNSMCPHTNRLSMLWHTELKRFNAIGARCHKVNVFT